MLKRGCDVTWYISDKSESEESGTAASNVKSSKFVFYYGMKDVFSQFHPAKFTVDGQEYNCTEQYMQHQKAGRYI